MNLQNLSPAIISQFSQFKTQEGKREFLKIKIENYKATATEHILAFKSNKPICGEQVKLRDILQLEIEIREMETIKISLNS